MDIQIIRRSNRRDGLETGRGMSLCISTKILAHARSWNPIEDFYEDQASDKTADMGPEGNASYIAWRKACRKQLNKKPIGEKDKGGDFDKLEKDEDRNQRHYSGPRIEKEVGPHDAGNCAARPNRWDIGIPVGQKMDDSSSHPAEKVKDEIANMAEPVLNIVSEDVEKPHISEDMEKSPMEKHGGQEWKPLLKDCKLYRELRIRIS